MKVSMFANLWLLVHCAHGATKRHASLSPTPLPHGIQHPIEAHTGIARNVAPTKAPTEPVTNHGLRANRIANNQTAPTTPPETSTLAETSVDTEAPTVEPASSETPTKEPTKKPTIANTKVPSSAPVETSKPTKKPTSAPTVRPTKKPTSSPTPVPTKKPSRAPTANPTKEPTTYPTLAPSLSIQPAETSWPSASPTQALTSVPSFVLSSATSESIGPSASPKYLSSVEPSVSTFPSAESTFMPTVTPLKPPSEAPSTGPSVEPSSFPSSVPSLSAFPTGGPSSLPSVAATGFPSVQPSLGPSDEPSLEPSEEITAFPSESPTALPTYAPSQTLSEAPSVDPSSFPSQSPHPSSVPSKSPRPTTVYEAGFEDIFASLSVPIRAGSLMDGPTIAVFETTTMNFINEYLPADDIISITSVRVTNQVLEQRRVLSPKMNRALQATDLRVEMDVVALWLADDTVSRYPLQQKIERTFEKNYSDYASNLVDASSFFRVGFESAKTADAASTTETSLPVSGPGLIIIGVVTGCALVGIVVSLLMWRRRGRAGSRDPNLDLPNKGSQDVSASSGYISNQSMDSPTESDIYSDGRSLSKRSLFSPPKSSPWNVSQSLLSPQESNSNLSQASDCSNSPISRYNIDENPTDTSEASYKSIDTSVSNSARYELPPPPQQYSPFSALSTINESLEIMQDIDLSTPRGGGTPRNSSDFVQVQRFSALTIDDCNHEHHVTTPKHAKFEDCNARSPKVAFVQGQETPKGTQFMQLNTSSAEKTGGILDDLTRFERAWDVQLDSKVNAITETPRANNLEKFKKAPRSVLYGDGEKR